MKLTPHQILQKLGFDVPFEGVTINPDEAFLHDSVLRMAGRSIDISTIPDSEFEGLHAGMAGLVSIQRREPVVPTTPHAIEVTRSMAQTVIKQVFKLSPR